MVQVVAVFFEYVVSGVKCVNLMGVTFFKT